MLQKRHAFGAFISEKLLTKVVLNELNIIITKYLNVDDFEEQITLEESNDNRKENLEKEIETYEKKKLEYSKGIKDLYMDKAKGIITEEDFISFSKEFYDNREKLEKLLTEKNKELNEIADVTQSLNNKKEILEQYIDVKILTREMIENLINYIYVGRRNPKTKKLPIEIHWKI